MNNQSVSSFDFDGMLNQMRELQSEKAKHPTAFVTTRCTLQKIKQETDSQESGTTTLLMDCMGVPIEDYPTVIECMDRMMQQNDGERLQLILAEDIPSDCFDHPWLKSQVSALCEEVIQKASYPSSGIQFHGRWNE